MYLGVFPQATGSLPLIIKVKDADGILVQPDGDVELRSWVDGAEDYSTTADALVTKSVSGATNANPIVITTSSDHHLVSGMRVTIASVGGNTNANGTWVITRLTDTTFSIPATGNNNYTAGGTVKRTGLFVKEVTLSNLDLTSKCITATYSVGGNVHVQHFRFDLY